MEVLKIENLNLKLTKEFYVLSDINLTVNSGEHIAIIGVNGSGRTPLLRCMCGLEKNFDGQIFIDGQDIKKFDFSSNFQLGFLPTYPIFFDAKSVRKNLEYVLKSRKVDKTLIATKVNDVLNFFELNRIADYAIYQLSDFEKFLVAIARLKLRDLDMLVIDSFEENFSEKQVETINKFLSSLVGEKTAVIKSCSTLTDFDKNFTAYAINNGVLTKQKNSQ